jgi:hypothetical protein
MFGSKMSRIVSLAVGLCSLAVCQGVVSAEEHHHNRCPQRHFGKFSEWSEPINLGPVVNSPFDDNHAAISANGLSLYITSNRPGGVGAQDIWVSQRASINDDWGPPQNLGPVINTEYNDASPDLTPDGHWMYFHSPRPGGCGNADIYVSYRANTNDDFAWEPPVNLGCVINTEFFENAPTFFQDEETGTTSLYLSTLDRPDGLGSYDIYVSTLLDDGTFGPALLVPELSSPYWETRTAIRRDGLEIFFGSQRPGGFGAIDLWVSTRKTTRDAWSTPVNLGATLNTEDDDGAPALSCDGTTMYFYSARPDGFGGLDLYVTTRTELCDENSPAARGHGCEKK